MKSGFFSNRVISFALCILLTGCWTAYAGNIDPDTEGHKYAWGENTGWINLEPSTGPGVTVTDTAVTGYAWGENVGWIRMDPDNGGVINDGSGNLSGYAWGENIGWISFSCEDSNTCATVDYGVTIDPCTGVFNGFAWAENVGWISFYSNGAVPFSITTSWRVDSDNDGTPDCNDGCANDPDKTAPGTCGCGEPDTDTCNVAPDQPVIITPNDGDDNISLMPLLQVHDFTDFDVGDTHSMTQWQISTEGDFSSLVMDIISPASLTEMRVPECVLTGETQYFMRVSFFDALGDASEWSETVSFTTGARPFVDDNDNNIPDDQEVDPDLNLDLDGDSVQDTEQEGTKCVSLADDLQMCVQAGVNVASIDALEFIDPDSIDDDRGRPDEIPVDMLAFRLTLIDPEEPGSVIILISGGAPLGARLYNYTIPDGWIDFMDHVLNVAVEYDDMDSDAITSMSIEFEIEDGGLGDTDGALNGIIVDLSGLGITEGNDTDLLDMAESQDSGNSDFSGTDGGCFIDTLMK